MPVKASHLWRTEAIAGISAFLTITYILILNPILLSQLGIAPTTAFWATVLTAGLGTIVMGWWGKLPIVVASAPSLTTALIATTIGHAGLPWQAALWAVVFSGLCCFILTMLGWRYRIMAYFPTRLQHSLVFATAGLLFGLSLQQVGLARYPQQWLEISFSSTGLGILMVGLATIILARRWSRTRGVAPLLGLISGALCAHAAGLAPIVNYAESTSLTAIPAELWHWLSFDLLTWPFLLAVLIFTIIDFFAGLGRYTGLMGLLPPSILSPKSPQLKKALYIDSLGSMGSGLLGGGSLSVFISSSAVGIVAGGRTGKMAIIVGLLILACLALTPLIEAVPRAATGGVLLFMGYLLLKLAPKHEYNLLSQAISIITALTCIMTFSLDLAIGVAFAGHALLAWQKSEQPRQALVLGVISLLIWSAIIASRIN